MVWGVRRSDRESLRILFVWKRINATLQQKHRTFHCNPVESYHKYSVWMLGDIKHPRQSHYETQNCDDGLRFVPRIKRQSRAADNGYFCNRITEHNSHLSIKTLRQSVYPISSTHLGSTWDSGRSCHLTGLCTLLKSGCAQKLMASHEWDEPNHRKTGRKKATAISSVVDSFITRAYSTKYYISGCTTVTWRIWPVNEIRPLSLVVFQWPDELRQNSRITHPTDNHLVGNNSAALRMGFGCVKDRNRFPNKKTYSGQGDRTVQ